MRISLRIDFVSHDVDIRNFVTGFVTLKVVLSGCERYEPSEIRGSEPHWTAKL